MIEVELKFEIVPRSRTLLQAKLAAMPLVRWPGRIENADTYYDTANFDCLQQAVFLRIRNRAHLEIKFHEQADPAHTHSTERVFPLDAAPPLVKEMNVLCSRFVTGWLEAETVEEAIRANTLLEFAHIQNRRTQYMYEDLVLSVDRVKGLGDFFEIETHCEEAAETELRIAKLQRFASALAFPSLQPVWVGYVELWLRRHLPQAYQLGKYRVENGGAGGFAPGGVLEGIAL